MEDSNGWDGRQGDSELQRTTELANPNNPTLMLILMLSDSGKFVCLKAHQRLRSGCQAARAAADSAGPRRLVHIGAKVAIAEHT